MGTGLGVASMTDLFYFIILKKFPCLQKNFVVLNSFHFFKMFLIVLQQKKS